MQWFPQSPQDDSFVNLNAESQLLFTWSDVGGGAKTSSPFTSKKNWSFVADGATANSILLNFLYRKCKGVASTLETPLNACHHFRWQQTKGNFYVKRQEKLSKKSAAASLGYANNCVVAPHSIAELARALRNDVDLSEMLNRRMSNFFPNLSASISVFCFLPQLAFSLPFLEFL